MHCMNSVDRTVGPPFLFPSSQWMIRLLVVLMQDPSFAVDRFKVPPSSRSSGLASSTP
jgi:hypothetical protein